MARQTMLRKLFNKKDVLVYVVNCFLNLNFKPVSTDFVFMAMNTREVQIKWKLI